MRALKPSVSAHRANTLALRAQQMRSAPTPSEHRLWEELRAGKLGVAFRRQVPLGGRFIADFLAPVARLVVEVDGGCHQLRRRADARRDEWLRRRGYRVLRLEAELIVRDLREAVALVRAGIASSS